MFWRGKEHPPASVVVPFDADRPAVEAAKRDPEAFEIVYRKYVYPCAWSIAAAAIRLEAEAKVDELIEAGREAGEIAGQGGDRSVFRSLIREA